MELKTGIFWVQSPSVLFRSHRSKIYGEMSSQMRSTDYGARPASDLKSRGQDWD